MNIKEASNALRNKFIGNCYFTAVGIGKFKEMPCLYLYVKNTQLKQFDLDTWKGFKVFVREMGTPRAC